MRRDGRRYRRWIWGLVMLYVVLAAGLAAVAWARAERLISLDHWLGLSLLGFAVGLMPWQGIGPTRTVKPRQRRQRYVHDRQVDQ